MQRMAEDEDGEAEGPVVGYDAFFEALVSGRLKLGQPLKQEELPAVPGVTLSPMRELTALLENQRLITVRRRISVRSSTLM